MTMVELDIWDSEPTNYELRMIEETNGPTTNTTEIYLHDIGPVPLLTANEEVFWAIKIAKPRYLAPVLFDAAYADEDITPVEASRIIDISKNEAEEARRHFTEANLKLVVSIAKKYRMRGVDLDDLIQEGNLGLMHAVEKFDWTKGYRFSTYTCSRNSN